MNSYEYLFKFIMIGDSNVGKSCLLLRFLQGKFKNQHEPTLGVEFGSKIFSIKNTLVKLQIWDTAGQESFKSITRAYYKGSIAALLVFDLTNESSFANLRHWLYELKTHSHQKMRIVLIGNKSDLSKDREVSEDMIQNFIKQNKIENYFQTSALNGGNVEKPFLKLGNQVLEDIEKGVIVVDQSAGFGVKKLKKNKDKYQSSAVAISREPNKDKEKEKCAC